MCDIVFSRIVLEDGCCVLLCFRLVPASTVIFVIKMCAVKNWLLQPFVHLIVDKTEPKVEVNN